MENLSLELRKMARKAGLCDRWFSEWKKDETDESLFDKYKKGIDFSIEYNWISNDFIKRHWDKPILQANNIFVDDKNISKDSLKGIIIVNGDCDMTLNFSAFDVADVYIRHTSKVIINAWYMARIMLNVYDDAEVTINSNVQSRVYVYKHSPHSVVKNIGDNDCIIHEEYK